MVVTLIVVMEEVDNSSDHTPSVSQVRWMTIERGGRVALGVW